MKHNQPAKRRGSAERASFRGECETWMTDPATGLSVPGSYSKDKNLIMLAAHEAILGRLHYISPSALTIKSIAVGIGTTAPTSTDTGLVSLTLAKDISSWDDSGFSDIPRSTAAVLRFEAAEANAEIAELGAFFDDDSLVSRVIFGQGNITAATKASPAVITSAGHGLTSGNRVKIESVGGMTELNGNYYYVAVLSSSTFALYSDAGLGAPVNSGSYGVYTSGGTWTKVKKKLSPKVFNVRYSYLLS